VTIYDRKSLPGGLDTYGMAEYKMSQAVSVEEAKQVADLGVEFRLNTEIIASAVESGANGETPENETSAEKHVSFEDLQSRNSTRFSRNRFGRDESFERCGRKFNRRDRRARFYRTNQNARLETVPLGGTVAVIGAGNTAIDAVTQAKRLGAERVLMVYRRTERDISAYNTNTNWRKKTAWNSSGKPRRSKSSLTKTEPSPNLWQI
jgi:dihydropyrimidine dehydrogenase (NAD+) subunit PreT